MGLESIQRQTILSGENERMECNALLHAFLTVGSPVGLKNVGNTCYFNSMLQTYFMIPDFRRAVLTFPDLSAVPTSDPNKPVITCNFCCCSAIDIHL